MNPTTDAPPLVSPVSSHEDVDLSVICHLVTQRGGHIQVKNTSPHGTTLTIFLPPADISVRTCEPTDFSLPATGQMTRILVVDDDEALRRFASTVLDSAGFSVIEADSGEEAIRLMEEDPEPIHLILADVVMPKMSGRQLVSQLTSLYPQMKVLLMSGFPNVSGLLNGIASRTGRSTAECEVLAKPFTPEGLLQKVRRLLDQPVEST
jgi:CheY-like chemotaxis protein